MKNDMWTVNTELLNRITEWIEQQYWYQFKASNSSMVQTESKTITWINNSVTLHCLSLLFFNFSFTISIFNSITSFKFSSFSFWLRFAELRVVFFSDEMRIADLAHWIATFGLRVSAISLPLVTSSIFLAVFALSAAFPKNSIWNGSDGESALVHAKGIKVQCILWKFHFYCVSKIFETKICVKELIIIIIIL